MNIDYAKIFKIEGFPQVYSIEETEFGVVAVCELIHGVRLDDLCES